ncbi:MAG: hypothetical protein ACREEK_07105 [Bradyrhizobium sp.]
MHTNELNFDELNKVAGGGGVTTQPVKPPVSLPKPTPLPITPFDPHPLPYPVGH